MGEGIFRERRGPRRTLGKKKTVVRKASNQGGHSGDEIREVRKSDAGRGPSRRLPRERVGKKKRGAQTGT